MKTTLPLQIVQSLEVPAFRLLDSASGLDWLSWLSGRTTGEGYTGFDATGWEASTWVLHSIFEDPSLGYRATHDDLHRQRVAARIEAPSRIEAILDASGAVVIGGASGMAGPVGVECVRLTWRDLADRLGLTLGDSEVPPCFRWFPYRSWPIGLHPPDEGSLDEASLDVLVEQLVRLSPGGATTPCVGYYSPLARGNFEESWLCEFQLGEVRTIIDPSQGRLGSPSNWWPVNMTWMVYTDWDLWATRVSGPESIIDAIEREEALETMAWPITDTHG